jgi:hypothetical protein
MSRYPSSTTVMDFLIKTGWTPSETPNQSVQVFSRGKESVSLPLESGYSDFELRMELLLKRLAMLDGMSLIDLPDQVDRRAFDNITWSISGGRISGSIPLSSVESVVQAVKRLHIYAAASLESRVPMHGRRVSRRARGVAEHLRLGPTTAGSYVLPVRLESSVDLRTRLLSQLQEPEFATYSFEQRSMELLLGAFRALVEIVGDDQQLRPRTDIEIVRLGLSHEYVAAVLDLLSGNGVDQVSMSATVFGEPTTEIVSLNSTRSEELRLLAERLFQARLEGEDEVRGKVISLRRKSPGAGGSVRVRRTDMGEEDYLIASDADASGVEIVVRGTLVSEPRALPRLTEVEQVTIPEDRIF